MTDHDVMIAVRDGDTGKLGLLFERHHKHLFNYFLLGTHNRQASEDMVQDVFYRMLKYRHTYRSRGSFKTWMFTIARNVRADYFREHGEELLTPNEQATLFSSDPNPEALCEHENDIALLREALARLPEDKREIIIMNRFHNMRCKEIGTVLGCKNGTVKVRIHRAMKELTDMYFTLTGENKP